MLGGEVLLQQCQQFKTVDAGHDHVQKDQGIVAALGVVQSALGGVNRSDIIGVIQNGLEKIGLHRTVIDDQNSLHGDTPFIMTPAGGMGGILSLIECACCKRRNLRYYIRVFSKGKV